MIDNEASMPHRRKGETEERASNGADGDVAHVESHVDSARRGFIPKNAWEFLWGITLKFGFPALMCVALGWYVVTLGTASREAAKAAHEDFKKVMAEQTAAIREGNAEQHRMTEAMIRLDSKIDAHLRAEDNRHR